MLGEFLYGINEGALFGGTVLVLYACAEVGFRYGRRFADRTSPEIHTHVATIEGALLGLMALLLGFAFAMAMNRFDARKKVVMDEANDLQTAFLRAQLLSERRADPASELLMEYLEARIAYYRASPEERARVEEATGKLQIRLWNEAVAAAREDPNEVTTGYYIEALNELIDDNTKRSTAMENHVPEVILVLLILVAGCTIAITGYSSGLRRKRLKALRAILILLLPVARPMNLFLGSLL